MKRNTALVRRIKTLSTESIAAIQAECLELKLTKYLGEVAGALCEHRLRTASDVALLTEFSTFLHGQYEEWRGHLSSRLRVQLAGGGGDLEPGRLRMMLRWAFECCLSGVLSLTDDLAWLISQLPRWLPLEDDQAGRQALPLGCMLAKNIYPLVVGDKEAGRLPIAAPLAQRFEGYLRDYFKAMCRSLIRHHQQFTALQRRARHHYEQRGDLSLERSEELKAAHEALDKLQVALASLAEALGETLPRLRNEQVDEEVGMQEGRMVFTAAVINENVWETEEDAAFYESLPAAATKASSSVEEGEEDGSLLLAQAIDQDPDQALASQPGEELGQTLSNLLTTRLPDLHSAEAVDTLAVDLLAALQTRSQRKRLAEVCKCTLLFIAIGGND